MWCWLILLGIIILTITILAGQPDAAFENGTIEFSIDAFKKGAKNLLTFGQNMKKGTPENDKDSGENNEESYNPFQKKISKAIKAANIKDKQQLKVLSGSSIRKVNMKMASKDLKKWKDLGKQQKKKNIMDRLKKTRFEGDANESTPVVRKPLLSSSTIGAEEEDKIANASFMDFNKKQEKMNEYRSARVQRGPETDNGFLFHASFDEYDNPSKTSAFVKRGLARTGVAPSYFD
jgi:hypothetical protein